jgi:hypothetical protein
MPATQFPSRDTFPGTNLERNHEERNASLPQPFTVFTDLFRAVLPIMTLCKWG